MKQMIRFILGVVTLALVSSPVFAANEEGRKGVKKDVTKVSEEATTPSQTSATMPPGISKKGSMPKGLEKKGKTPKGWSKGKKEGWSHTVPPTAPQSGTGRGAGRHGR